MGIGRRIKEAREARGLTQGELGKLVGVTSSAITNYESETSHPREPILYNLIDALKVDANYLFQDCVNLSEINENVSEITEQQVSSETFYNVLVESGIIEPGGELTGEQSIALEAMITLIGLLLKKKR